MPKLNCARAVVVATLAALVAPMAVPAVASAQTGPVRPGGGTGGSRPVFAPRTGDAAEESAPAPAAEPSAAPAAEPAAAPAAAPAGGDNGLPEDFLTSEEPKPVVKPPRPVPKPAAPKPDTDDEDDLSGAAAPAAPAAPAAAGAAAAAAQKPASRTLQFKTTKIEFLATVTPGIPEPGRPVTVSVHAMSIPLAQDANYGDRLPIENGLFTANVQHEAGKGEPQVYQLKPTGEAGRYAAHFTPTTGGVWRFVVKGEFDKLPVDAAFNIAVGIWPLRKEDLKQDLDENQTKRGGVRQAFGPPGARRKSGPVRATAAGAEGGEATAAPLVSVNDVALNVRELGYTWVDFANQFYLHAVPSKPDVQKFGTLLSAQAKKLGAMAPAQQAKADALATAVDAIVADTQKNPASASLVTRLADAADAVYSLQRSLAQ
jgi:hypothetical protein